MNHPPSKTAQVLTGTGTLIPNSVGNAGGLFAGLPRMAGAALMGRGSTNVELVTFGVNREHLEALAALLESAGVTVLERSTRSACGGRGRPHAWDHARGEVALAV